jgi:hypothetical protein
VQSSLKDSDPSIFPGRQPDTGFSADFAVIAVSL